ncbi:Cytochrome P450 [Hibiscus syriacus]|uniref:Cytochrome P450 n=1 Tax=Hibiscus syriacus TaxID=106335 RepID=A0A6A2YMJ4_HIBSY|nr:Cytochrome P450 [Hibiscus syriacus]
MMNSQGIKGPPYRFIHGNNKQAAQIKKETSIKSTGLTHDIFPRVQPHIYSWLNNYGKNYLYWKGTQAELVITEPELAKEILKNSEKAFLKRKLNAFDSKILGEGLVMAEGEKWVKLRRLANYVFHGESIKNMSPAVISSVETMLEKWKVEEGREIEVFHEFRLLTSEVISRTAFGSSYVEGEKIFNTLHKLSVMNMRNIHKNRIRFIGKFWRTADLVEAEKFVKVVKDSVMEIIKKREYKVLNGEAESFGHDFLGLLVNAYHEPDEKKRLSFEDLVEECRTFYFGGQETVHSLLSWTVLLLSIHGDWQEKARREVMEIFGNQNPHPDGIAKLKTMSMIINETLRLYGSANSMPREVAREVRLGKLVLPANMHLLILNTALHHDPQLWGDEVHLFRPERFADGIAKATRYKRGCRYAMTLSPAYVHNPALIVTLQPQHGIQVILEPLHNDD